MKSLEGRTRSSAEHARDLKMLEAELAAREANLEPPLTHAKYPDYERGLLCSLGAILLLLGFGEPTVSRRDTWFILFGWIYIIILIHELWKIWQNRQKQTPSTETKDSEND